MEVDGLTNVNHGRLYQNLDMLVEDGWVSKGKKDQRTNAYATTTAAPRERPQGVAVVDGDLRARADRHRRRGRACATVGVRLGSISE